MSKSGINRTLILVLVLSFIGCKSNEEPGPDDSTALYFPALTESSWQTIDPEDLGWKTSKIPDLKAFLENTNTRAFLVLKDGKIAFEEYFGENFSGDPFDENSYWFWASAGKTLTAFTIGIAQEKGYLSITDQTNQYLGDGWSGLSQDQENQIQILHQLTMTSGMDDHVDDVDCTNPECLQYLAAPGTRWAYHNAVYTLLDPVIENATGQSWDVFFNENLSEKIGMDGFWLDQDFNHVYYSTPRSMARFGLLISNNGVWADTPVMEDENYFRDMINTSQQLNRSYGYLWWLNGKESFMIPSLQTVFTGHLIPSAPEDIISGIGKYGQIVSIIPGENLVIIRMGEAPNESTVPILYYEELWEKIASILP